MFYALIRSIRPHLMLDWDKVKTLELDPFDSITEAELEAISEFINSDNLTIKHDGFHSKDA